MLENELNQAIVSKLRHCVNLDTRCCDFEKIKQAIKAKTTCHWTQLAQKEPNQ